MSRIHSSALTNIFAEVESTDKVSLFVYSTKSSRLVKVDLDNLSIDQRTMKLQKWSKDNRFVAVVEKIDNSVLAFINAKYVEQLQNQQDLSIDGIKGKKIAVKALSEAESERLSQVGEMLESFLIAIPKQELKDQMHEDKSRSRSSEALKMREYLSNKNNPKLNIDKLIFNMANIPHKIKMEMLIKWGESNREIARRSKEEAAKKEKIQEEIKRQLIKEDILERDILKHDIMTIGTKNESKKLPNL